MVGEGARQSGGGGGLWSELSGLDKQAGEMQNKL